MNRNERQMGEYNEGGLSCVLAIKNKPKRWYLHQTKFQQEYQEKVQRIGLHIKTTKRQNRKAMKL